MKSIFIGLSLLLALCFASAAAQDESRAAGVKKLVQDMGTFTIRGEFDKLIDLTYDPLVNVLGGREKAIDTTEKGMGAMKAKGVVLTSYEVGEPGEFHSDGTRTYVIVPTRLTMKFPSGRASSKSYVLGISADDSKSWKFVDGAIMDNRGQREKLLPNLPKKLVLPAKEAPVINKD